MENPTTVERKKISAYGLVLFPLPFHGHITPMLHLANALHSKGFSITIIHTNFNPPNPASYPKFTFRSIDDGIVENKYSDENIMGVFNLLGENCLKPFHDCLSEVLNDVGKCPIACLISDPMWLFAGDVAKSLNLRNLALRTGSLSASVVYNSVQHLIEKGYYSALETSPETPLLEFPPLKVKDLPILYGDAKQAYVDHFSNYAASIRNSSGFICNSFDELEPAALDRIRKELPIPIFPIGPIHKYSLTEASTEKADNSSISWLNTQAPGSVLYVSYGSTASISEANFLEIAWGLADSKQPFLWAVRPGLIRNSKWIDPLPDGFLETVSGRGKIVKWAPQDEVLAHPAVGGFLSHCGWNSVLESVSEGVPLICVPCFADQMMNARYASGVWKVGIQLENGPRREEITDAIKRLMAAKEGQQIRFRMASLKVKASLALQEGGSSYQALENLISYILSFQKE